MPLVVGVVGTGNLDPWPKSQSMGEACGRPGTYSVEFKKQKGRAVYYSEINVMGKEQGLSRGLNNRLDIYSARRRLPRFSTSGTTLPSSVIHVTRSMPSILVSG